jgi:hypothetical protein
VSFAGASLHGADFTQAVLAGVNFAGAAVSLESGVPLFAVDAQKVGPIAPGPLPAALSDAFTAHGYALLPGSSVIAGTDGPFVKNGGDEAPTSGAGAYAMFNLRADRSGRLHVYGASLWITSIDEDGHASFGQATFAATGLNEDMMRAAATYPNGEPPNMFVSPVTWKQMMTAREPPAPPPCVPGPDRWCAPRQASRFSRVARTLARTTHD